MSNPVSLAPLLARLKRTDAPTVEDLKRWDVWWANGEFVTVADLNGATYLYVKCIRRRLDELCAPWTPIPSREELLALAALPLKVAETVIERAELDMDPAAIVAACLE